MRIRSLVTLAALVGWLALAGCGTEEVVVPGGGSGGSGSATPGPGRLPAPGQAHPTECMWFGRDLADELEALPGVAGAVVTLLSSKCQGSVTDIERYLVSIELAETATADEITAAIGFRQEIYDERIAPVFPVEEGFMLELPGGGGVTWADDVDITMSHELAMAIERNLTNELGDAVLYFGAARTNIWSESYLPGPEDLDATEEIARLHAQFVSEMAAAAGAEMGTLRLGRGAFGTEVTLPIYAGADPAGWGAWVADWYRLVDAVENPGTATGPGNPGSTTGPGAGTTTGPGAGTDPGDVPRPDGPRVKLYSGDEVSLELPFFPDSVPEDIQAAVDQLIADAQALGITDIGARWTATHYE